ncbi:MAG: hypothetical protein Q8Q76_00020 [Methylotenera sp.]|nr:hypothetical protein [Methylotenera sp.]
MSKLWKHKAGFGQGLLECKTACSLTMLAASIDVPELQRTTVAK